jgi:hypothetical protein
MRFCSFFRLERVISAPRCREVLGPSHMISDANSSNTLILSLRTKPLQVASPQHQKHG